MKISINKFITLWHTFHKLIHTAWAALRTIAVSVPWSGAQRRFHKPRLTDTQVGAPGLFNLKRWEGVSYAPPSMRGWSWFGRVLILKIDTPPEGSEKVQVVHPQAFEIKQHLYSAVLNKVFQVSLISNMKVIRNEVSYTQITIPEVVPFQRLILSPLSQC